MDDPNQRFADDMKYAAEVSLRDAGRALAQTMLDAGMHGGWGSGLALKIIEVIEEDGGTFIDTTAPRLGAAWGAKGADRKRLTETFSPGLDRVLAATDDRRRDKSGAFGGSMSGLLDQMRPQVRARLHQRLKHAIRSVEGEPPKPWRERHPGLWLVVTNLISGSVGLAVGLLSKHFG